ncbi:MAG: winged helix-turn-helix transcriptional regulator [Hellea sp.]|nr:winged helix-turn-helix transcriptional regulator [Hellea sp.]
MAIARPIDRRLFFWFDRAHTLLTKEADSFLSKRSGVSTAQASVLIYLGFHDSCHLSELADGIGRNNPAVTGLVNRMEAQDLVERIHGGLDGRRKRVRLTDSGWAKREQVREDFRIFNERLGKGLNETEMDAVLKFLSLAPENMSKKNG